MRLMGGVRWRDGGEMEGWGTVGGAMEGFV